MEKLHDDLSNHINDNPNSFENLLNTAIQWAEYVLRNNEGEALDAGLNISKELVNYHWAVTLDK